MTVIGKDGKPAPMWKDTLHTSTVHGLIDDVLWLRSFPFRRPIQQQRLEATLKELERRGHKIP